MPSPRADGHLSLRRPRGTGFRPPRSGYLHGGRHCPQPLYLNFEAGSASISNGAADCFVLIPEENFNLGGLHRPVPHLGEGPRAFPPFSQEYRDLVKEQMDSLEGWQTAGRRERFQEILEEAYGELNGIGEELRDGRETQRRERRRPGGGGGMPGRRSWMAGQSWRMAAGNLREKIAEAQEGGCQGGRGAGRWQTGGIWQGIGISGENRPRRHPGADRRPRTDQTGRGGTSATTPTLGQTEQTLIAARTQLEMGKGELAQKEEELQSRPDAGFPAPWA